MGSLARKAFFLLHLEWKLVFHNRVITIAMQRIQINHKIIIIFKIIFLSCSTPSVSILFYGSFSVPPFSHSRFIGRTLGTANRAPVSVTSYTGGRRLAASRFNQAGQVSSTDGTGFSLEASPRVVGRPSFPSVYTCFHLLCVQLSF
jgi:hypothetical protein